ncbi:putative methylase [Dendrothele bispora CBS 962.96]|uniref:Putative methylase n=1 Tax=Dendrothele bispora (strain CBS 962.96) TaxID=1314807 RepID=A0A4S8LDK8_DENBC|nr:putative methylase [Dendrothele bispora CBS 962.96]
MIPTPDLSHLTSTDYEHVYEPAEDTFLLLDALEEHAGELKEMAPLTCLEVGYATTSRVCPADIVQTVYLCTDVNPHACKCTRKTGTQNRTSLDVVHTSFAYPLHARLKHCIDIILFNPPYVPTLTEELVDAQELRGIEGSWAGGSDGMEITNKFLELVDSDTSYTFQDLLSHRGRMYLVALKENNIPEIQTHMVNRFNLQSTNVLSRRAGREHNMFPPVVWTRMNFYCSVEIQDVNRGIEDV